VTGRNDDQKQKEQEEPAAIKERQRNMTAKIEQENKELKQLTKRLVEVRKT
jgi:hypothetical protein